VGQEEHLGAGGQAVQGVVGQVEHVGADEQPVRLSDLW